MPIDFETGKLYLTRTEEKIFKIIKCRSKRNCWKCNSKISSGSFCLGCGYCKICLKCMEPFFKGYITSLKEQEKETKKLLSDFKSKELNMTKNNILTNLNDK